MRKKCVNIEYKSMKELIFSKFLNNINNNDNIIDLIN